MANVSSGIYVIEGLKIRLDALDRFSRHLPSPASDIVEQAHHAIASLQRIPSNRDEVVRFRDLLLKCLPVLMAALYDHMIGVEGPSTLSARLEFNVSRFKGILDEIQKKLFKPQSVTTSQFQRPKIKRHFVAPPQTSMLQSFAAELQRGITPFEIETSFIYAARLCSVSAPPRIYTSEPLLEALPRAKYARFDCERPDRPASCLKGTRRGIIRDAIAWILEPGPMAKRFFWLKGLAGTGKTTVAHTIAELAQGLGILGASFFFSRRGEAELSNPALVFPTIAYQLALLDPVFCRLITAAIRAEPQAATGSLKKQLDTLIVKPLAGLKPDDEQLVIIVFDAFDECEAVGAKTILQLLVDAIPSLPFCLKIWLSGRPEVHIRSVLVPTNRDIQITALHEIETSIIQADILLYLATEIRKLPKKKEVNLPTDWVTDVQIELLAQAAGVLFVFAATLLRSLEEAVSLPRQLDLLLTLATRPLSADEESNPFVYLDDLYKEVLRGPITRSNRTQVLGLLQAVLGSLTLLRDPLPLDALERLTNMRNGDAEATIRFLYSVILPPVPPDNCPRIYHKSFSDFLQDPVRCTDPDLFIDTPKHEGRLAARCLELLNKQLYKGMVENLNTFRLNLEVKDLGQKVRDALPAELQYACKHWASHLKKIRPGDAYISELLNKLVAEKLFPWIEAISWLQYTDLGIQCLEVAQSWAATSTKCSKRIIRLLNDGYWVLRAHNSAIALGAQHVWQTVLSLAPLEVMWESSDDSFANTVSNVVRGIDEGSPLCLMVLEGHVGDVTAITCSPDGKNIASGSSDTIVMVWEATTGVCKAMLRGHSSRVTSIAFSPEGARLASGSFDNTVRLWDVDTGVCMTMFAGPSDLVSAVAFSPDGSQLASGSFSDTISLWDTTSGARTAVLKGHSSMVTSITFSPNGTHLKAYYYGNVILSSWNLSTGCRVETLGCDQFDHGSRCTFSHRDRGLYWADLYGPERLACILPPRTGVTHIASNVLREAVAVVAIGCQTGRLIVLHIQLPIRLP